MQRDIAYLLDIMESAKLALDYVKMRPRAFPRLGRDGRMEI